MKKLDEEQKQAVIQLTKILFAREMVGFVEMPSHKGDPRASSCWYAEARNTILFLPSDKREELLKQLGLEASPLKP